ncbi:APC family permease [archaeon]|nr:MAG: APC family permease [archaeon]
MYIMCLGLFSTAYGFVFFLTRHLQTLASADILPSPLAKVSSYTNSPFYASVIGCFVSYILLLFVYYNVEDFITSVFRVVFMAVCVKYVFIFRAYVIMQHRAVHVHTNKNSHSQPASQPDSSTVPKDNSEATKSGFLACCCLGLTRLPWGVCIALLGALIFAVTFISLAYYQTNDNWSAIVFCGCLAFCMLYYSLYGRHEELFSDEERDMVMKKFVYTGMYAIIK